MRFLPNLRSTDLEGPVDPWTFVPETPIPDIVRKDKKLRDLWINNPKTKHNVYSAVEGLAPNLRVTGARRDDGNPPHSISALILDYDCPVTVAEAVAGCQRAVRPPNWWEITLSGNGRAVWQFERALLVPTYKYASDFLVFLAEKLRARNVAPGVDEGALAAPERYYTNSGNWISISEAKVPYELLLGWQVEFSVSYKHHEEGIELPLDRAAEMLAAKYPRFAEWPGAWELNAQGPSFWINGSNSPKSALVKATGLMTFSAHAPKSWYSWEDLLGKASVDEFRANLIGAAVADIFFDGKHYFRRISSGHYKPFSKEDVVQDLRVTRGLSPKPDKAGVSAIDRALSFIRDNNYVIGAAPLTFQPRGLCRIEGEPVLNTSTRTPLDPHPHPVTWDDLPLIRDYLHALFYGQAEQLEWFLAWLHLGYVGALARLPKSGHNLFVVGGVGIGKTLLTGKVIGPLLGGSVDAGRYLLGEDKFGGELFESYVWRIDDSESTSSAAAHRRFSETIKRMAANTSFQYHCKFRQPLTINWRGRVVVTMNSDEESIRLIPDLSISIRDKIGLLRVVENFEGTGFRFPESAELERRIESELPKFARLLKDFVIPGHLVDGRSARFGIVPYHDESLVNNARHSSVLNGFHEILSDWTERHFTNNKDAKEWSGTAYQLHKALHEDPTAAPALRNYSPDAIQRALSGLKNRFPSGITCQEGQSGLRVWTVPRPTRASEPNTSGPEPTNSVFFQKQ